MAVATGSIIASIFMTVLIPLAVLAMTIFLGVWTYRDAENRGMSGILWTLVVILVPSFVGLIVYLCVRYDAKKVTCSNCMQKVNGTSKFCSSCGQELVPVVEVSGEDTNFKKSQRNILIGFFVSLGVMIVAVLLMIAFILTSVVGIVDTAVSAVSGISNIAVNDALDTLSDLDDLLGQDGIRLRVDGNDVYIKDEDGTELIHVDGDSESVDVDIASLKRIMDRYGIDYDDSMTAEEVIDALEEILEDLEDVENLQDLDDFKAGIREKTHHYKEYSTEHHEEHD